MGIRHDDRTGERGKKSGRPICLTRLFLNPALAGIEGKLRERKTAVYALIEREYKLVIQRVEQELQGVRARRRRRRQPRERARRAGAADPAPLLQRPRHLLEVADNIHPSDRFTYRMELRR